MQCVDAETLAAWADGGLPKPEAAAVELHLSECDRCTAMLATFVRSTPDTPATVSLWERWHLRWLVPVATAATVAALWVLIPSREPVPTAISDTDVATQAQAPAPAAPSQPPPTEDKKEQKLADSRTESPRAATPARPESSASTAFERSRADEARETAQPVQDLFAAAPPPAVAEADRAARRATDLQAKSEPAAPAAQAAPAAAPAPGRTAGLAAGADESTARTQRQGNTQAFAAVVAQFEVVSPNPMTRWRVIGAGRVERSTNQGAQWQPASLPEAATLTGGSSPAPSICWLVGRTGAVYVTTDGLRFIKVAFPDRTDFISIQAIDARRATVVTTDGRTMRTDDQGATWIRVTP